ncbi:glutamate racemase [Candidatus Peregrinibacteria bacterium]|nr:glutamate racemase [Candidatus Peregrinibacteria bacterium]
MIGLFDSGYGGLTVLKPIIDILPEYDYVYVGDNARTPYGTRSQETVLHYSRQAVDYLFDQGCTMIITACNTVSALALRTLQQEYLRDKQVTDKKILGVIRPVVEYAAKHTKTKRIGVVGTTGTIASRAYEIELQKIDSSIQPYSHPCPLLVPLIEEGWHHKPEARMILKKYLRPLKSANPDMLILGCTHYPLMYRDFKRYMGSRVHVLHTGNIVAESLRDYLERHPEIEKKLTRDGTRRYITTDCPDAFKKFGNAELSLSIDTVKTDAIW